MAMTMNPVVRTDLSDEQIRIATFVREGRGNLLVRARAGTGKTYLIRKCLGLMPGKIAIAAFNRKIAKEIRQKVQEDGFQRTTDVGTFHSFGWRVLQNCLSGARLEGTDKGSAGFRKFNVIAERLDIPLMLRPIVRQAIDRAQERLFGVVDPRTGQPIIAITDKAAWLEIARQYRLAEKLPNDQHIEIVLKMAKLQCSAEAAREALLLDALRFAAKGLQQSIKMARETFQEDVRGARRSVKGASFTGVVSYNEMLYLPLYFNMPMPQFDFVCVDEAQDSNPARREMARRMVKPQGRLMFVLDDRQAIYGFAGADSDATDLIIKDFRCTVFPMTTTFRCAKAIVRLVQNIVPDYKAADSNPEGTVRTINESDFLKETLHAATETTLGDAIICRNTAPLVALATSLLSRGIACHVEGRDVGKEVVRLAQMFPQLKTIPAYLRKLEDYRQVETARLLGLDSEATVEMINDQIDAVVAIANALPPGSRVEDIVAQVNKLFSDTPDGQKPKTVPLLSAHKSKGLEFDRVFGWGVSKFMPSKNANTPEELLQEENLIYVLLSRAIHEYCEVVVA